MRAACIASQIQAQPPIWAAKLFKSVCPFSKKLKTRLVVATKRPRIKFLLQLRNTSTRIQICSLQFCVFWDWVLVKLVKDRVSWRGKRRMHSWTPSQNCSSLLYSFFWLFPRRLNFMCRRFGTLCSIFIGRVNKKYNWDEIAVNYLTFWIVRHSTELVHFGLSDTQQS